MMAQRPRVGALRGLAHDRTSNVVWLFSDNAIFEVIVVNEQAGVWRAYLETALDPERPRPEYFATAMLYCEVRMHNFHSCILGW